MITSGAAYAAQSEKGKGGEIRLFLFLIVQMGVIAVWFKVYQRTQSAKQQGGVARAGTWVGAITDLMKTG